MHGATLGTIQSRSLNGIHEVVGSTPIGSTKPLARHLNKHSLANRKSLKTHWLCCVLRVFAFSRPPSRVRRLLVGWLGSPEPFPVLPSFLVVNDSVAAIHAPHLVPHDFHGGLFAHSRLREVARAAHRLRSCGIVPLYFFFLSGCFSNLPIPALTQAVRHARLKFTNGRPLL
jgi:hypothetical protein